MTKKNKIGLNGRATTVLDKSEPTATSALETIRKIILPNTTSDETVPPETGICETVSSETVPRETPLFNTTVPETAAADTAPRNTTLCDTIVLETAVSEPVAKETTRRETISSDTVQTDTTQGNTGSVPISESAQPNVSSGNVASAFAHPHVSPPPPYDKSNVPNTQGPQRFGPYELVWELRRDALSKTYAAKRDGISALLALRIFDARLTDSAQGRSIRNAAQKSAELTHINHISVYESGVSDDGAPYVVTDWVEGESLAETLKVVKRLDIARFLNIFGQVCDALTEAHSKSLVHGNLSPEKIVFADIDTASDVVKLIDFGMPADPIQCAFYIAPEQSMDASRADSRTDIYSLGCIMYEALVGTPPMVHHKTSQTGLNCLHQLASHYSPQSAEHKALKLLDCIVIKCMQKERSKRFRSVRELDDALNLVRDCICGGSNRKLPPKAEKLLLFRFLDAFDKKIVASLCAYILVSGFTCKCISEIQIQKDIDDAQLCSMSDPSAARQYWQAAVHHAAAANAPPHLMADLHWALADSLSSDGMQNERVSMDSIDHYEQALKYYGTGLRYRSNALELSGSINNAWQTIDDEQNSPALRDTTRQEARELFRQKRYADCAKTCVQFLNTTDDQEIAWYAARSYNELGAALPPQKAIRQFEKTVYYALKAQKNFETGNANLTMAIEQSGMIPDSDVTRQSLACDALRAGDEEAAQAVLTPFKWSWNGISGPISRLLSYYEALKNSTYKTRTHNGPILAKATLALERTLKLQEDVYGDTSPDAAETLSTLANCYRISGHTDKALAAYKRRLNMHLIYHLNWAPHGWSEGDPNVDTLAYVDLLAQTGQRKEAMHVLEQKLHNEDGTLRAGNPLCIRLLKAYADDKMTEQLEYTLSRLTPIVQPDRLPPPRTTIIHGPLGQNSGDAFALVDPPDWVKRRLTY